jgi:hypothetical protein
MDKLILLGNLLVGAYLTGLIWTIQVVHYPLFSYAERGNFSAFEAEHGLRISSIVLLPMLAELILAGLFLGVKLEGMPAFVPWVSAGLVGVIWLATFFVQVPQHNILAGGFDQTAHRLLVSSNWIRTVAWTAKTGLLGYVVWLQLAR